MIRWHTRQQSYDLLNSRNEVAETNTTTLALCAPVWSVRREQEHFVTGNSERIEGGLKSRAPAGAIVAEQLVESVVVDNLSGKLPLLSLSRHSQQAVRTTSASEAAKTGLVNSTTGALLGLGAWAIAGPVGAAIWWCAVAAGATAVVTGVAQGRAVRSSNNMRLFAERANEFLQELQAKGLTDEVFHQFVALENRADTDTKLEMLADIVEAAERCLGAEVSDLRKWAPFMSFNRYRVPGTRPVPLPEDHKWWIFDFSSGGASPGRDRIFHDYSPAGAISFGGR